MVVIVDRESSEAPVSRISRRRRSLTPLGLLLISVVGLIVLTHDSDPGPEPAMSPELSIPATVETLPSNQAAAYAWTPTEIASGDALRATRIPTGYAFPTRDGVVVLLDNGGVVRTRLPDAGTLRGIESNNERVVVFGSSSDGSAPTLWISRDGLGWTTVKFPWRGAVRTVGFDQGRLMVDGVRQRREGLAGILARETWLGRWQTRDTPLPTSNHFAVEGAFVVRERLDGDDEFRYYATSDFENFTYFADSMLIMSGNESAWAGVVDLDGVPALRVPKLKAPIVPPDWPVVSIRVEGDLIWLQTPRTLWSSDDGNTWEAIPLTGAGWSGSAMAIPVGDTARMAVSDVGGVVRVYEWRASG